MHPITTDLAELRRWIGRRVRHQGQLCLVVEIIDDGPALVLGALDGDSVIQGDQYGEGRRRVRPTHTVSIFGSDGLSLNPDYADLEFIETP